ncbi:transporter substrate-binding domain-containing protein [Paenibacillus ottowii]|uniref:Transporter substrate-binding domain-containing protein n=1 Tax=Paenibacillus ottowii TaxID=2315729 RepID=A0ABY3BBJ0_9BACL|nr:transporter substrate-binding domain-containing protein [Paenibacillus ottowii]NEU27503.1 transporter substrate-binding domain-containing protein [Paenibacillus polymyxa]TQS00796.1 transporter substrate-binding domain-containing protein [Paenibacillus ottowii]
MKTRKKGFLVTTLMALALFSLVLSACGTKPEASNTSNGAGSSNEAAANQLEAIKKAGVMKVGMMGTYPPYNFLNDNKELDGFDVDIAKELAKRIGVKVEFTAQEFSGLIPSLQKKKFDAVVSQVAITEDRKKAIDFTDPYITNHVNIIVNSKTNDITKLEDFKGKTIGVGLGTNDESYLRNEVLPKVGDFEIKTYDDVITSLKDLNSGRIDATINNLYALKPIIDKNGFQIKAVGEPVKSDQAAVAINQNTPELKEALNKALKEMKEDGTYKTIFKKWFGEEPKE